MWINQTYRCVRCGGTVVPGVNGLINGLSTAPGADPSGVIVDTLRGIHYREHCGDPDKPVEPMRLVPQEGR